MDKFKTNFVYLILAFSLIISCQKEFEFPASSLEMNDPEYLVEKSGPWEVDEREYIMFYYDPSLKDNIYSLISLHDSHFKHITSIIGMKSEELASMPKIKVWIFVDDQDKYRKTQLKGIHTIYDYFSVYNAAQNCKSAHEYGHLLAYYNWGFMGNKNYSLLLDEAFAYYVDEGRTFDFSYKKKARDILSNDSYEIKNILAGKRPFELFTNIGRKQAFVCATFIKYLIEKYGIEKFGELWKGVNKEDRKAFDTVYQKSLDALESEFYSYLGITI